VSILPARGSTPLPLSSVPEALLPDHVEIGGAVLIVDDNIINRRVLRRLVTLMGHRRRGGAGEDAVAAVLAA